MAAWRSLTFFSAPLFVVLVVGGCFGGITLPSIDIPAVTNTGDSDANTPDEADALADEPREEEPSEEGTPGDDGGVVPGNEAPANEEPADEADVVQPENDWTCGEQTVASIPAAGYVRESYSARDELDPADSPLAQVLFGAGVPASEVTWEQEIIYSLDSSGVVLARYDYGDYEGVLYYTTMSGDDIGDSHFSVEGGCMRLVPDAELAELTWNLDERGASPWYFDELLEDEGSPCGPSAMPLTRDGLWFHYSGPDDRSEEYICLQFTTQQACMNCWYADGVWHQETEVVQEITALGSLDNVTIHVSYYPDAPEVADIQEGDTIVATFRTTMTYQASASPEELGYHSADE